MHRDAFRVSVIDPGPGIPEEFKPRVFDRFAQADSSTSRLRGGTGLGLAICKMIIGKLGGTIDFVSTAGMGTTFYFDLPPRAQAAQPTNRNAAHATMKSPLKKIMLVEDDPDIQLITRLSLEIGGGYEVRVCTERSRSPAIGRCVCAGPDIA